MSEKIKLLVVDDEERFLQTLTHRLRLREFDVTPAASGQEAIELARSREFDLALLDLKMPGMGGEEVLRTLKEEHPLIEVVILTGHGSIDSAVDCTRAGSYNYLQKPCETEELLEVLKQAYTRHVERKLSGDRARLEELARIAVGESPLGILERLRALKERSGRR
jgi:two-component system NtrC family response regulator